VETLEALVRYMLKVTMRKRVVLGLPQPAALLQARALEVVDTLTLGLLPDSLKLTRDQVILLQNDNVVSEAAKAEGRTLEGIGLQPTAMEAVVPGYLWRFRKAGQFAKMQEHESAIPETLAPKPFVPRSGSGPALGPDSNAPSRMGVRWGTRG
jgi:NADH dehydrogenase